MSENAVIIDAATRFLRSNPELLALARRGAGETGRHVDDLLADTVRRVLTSGLETAAEKPVIVRLRLAAGSAGIAQRLTPG
jgi:hypothetical protein